jgi:tetratricopeptide (TPR) repeat protein
MICRLIILVCVCLCTSVPLPAQASADKQAQIQAHLHQAQQDLQNKRPDLAIKEFQAIVSIDPANLDARANLGVLEYFQADYAKAAPDLRAALQLDPSVSKLQALLGMSEKRMGQTAQAQADLEKAFHELKEQKLKIQVGLELIEADYALSDLGKAAEVANVLRQLAPEDVDILYAAHRVYSELADETMLSVAMLAPNSARMHQLMAHELARQAKDEEAVENYRQALKIDPHRPDIHFELAEMLNTRSSQEAQAEAEKEYKLALEGNPFDEKAESRLGDIALRRSEAKSALAHYSRALEMQPNDAGANLGMGKVLMSLHQPEKAVEYLERALKIEPFNAASHYRLGVLYRQLGQNDDAKRELAEFEKLKTMKNNLQNIYQAMRLKPASQEQPESEESK